MSSVVSFAAQDVILPWVEARSDYSERTSVHGDAEGYAQ